MDEMHYFQNMSSGSGGFRPRPHQGPAHKPRWRLHPNLPIPGKESAGADETLNQNIHYHATRGKFKLSKPPLD